MTEAEWLASNNPYEMLRPCRRIIRERPRKGWLFAVACCRRIWHLLPDQRSRDAVEMAARFADGKASEEQLQRAAAEAQAAHASAHRTKGKVGACPEWAAEYSASSNAWYAAKCASNFGYVGAGDGLIGFPPEREPGPEHIGQAHLLRCIFGNPFDRAAIDVTCLTSSVRLLASAAYDETVAPAHLLDPARLAVLSDALEEAGCDDPDLLAHLRGPGPHVRGCRALDLVLGKE